jgi:hypothetical protein
MGLVGADCGWSSEKRWNPGSVRDYPRAGWKSPNWDPLFIGDLINPGSQEKKWTLLSIGLLPPIPPKTTLLRGDIPKVLDLVFSLWLKLNPHLSLTVLVRYRSLRCSFWSSIEQVGSLWLAIRARAQIRRGRKTKVSDSASLVVGSWFCDR